MSVRATLFSSVAFYGGLGLETWTDKLHGGLIGSLGDTIVGRCYWLRMEFLLSCYQWSGAAEMMPEQGGLVVYDRV